MQQAHLHCLATEAQPDIERLVFEREHLFADLQNHLTAVVYQVQKAVPEPSLVPILQARLTALLEDDAVLDERLHAYRATLEQRRAQLRQGQKVLGGYGSPASTPAPMVIDRAGAQPSTPFFPICARIPWVPLDNIPLGCNGHTLLFARLAAIEDIKRLRRQPL